MATIYAATYIEKLVSDWDPEEGAGTEQRCTISEQINVEAPNLAALIDVLARRYFVDMSDLFIPEIDEGEHVTHIGASQVETADCLEPTDGETEQWKRGELKLYLCDYTFGVEKRETGPLDPAEFQAAGIKTH